MLLLSQPASAAMTDEPAPSVARTRPYGQRATLLALILILLVGCFLRLPSSAFQQGSPLHWLGAIHATPKFQARGFDEHLYETYVGVLAVQGLGSYPALAEHYVREQKQLPSAVLPPTRFVYIAAAYGWHEIWGADGLSSLKAVSSLFSVLLLGLATLFAWRLRGPSMALCVAALMAVAPTQIHMSQHALIDGVFAFWATLCLWLLWENLQRPGRFLWLLGYGAALALMVLTKENAMFAYLGLLIVLAANRWLHFGKITLDLCIVTIVGPLFGVIVLAFLCGGLTTMAETYRLLVTKAAVLQYAIITGDGPWYRYLVDLMIVSPVVVTLAIGGVFQLRKSDRAGFYLLLFVVASFAVMANIRYGMNLRYANMWDFPLRFLAAFCLWRTIPSGRRQALMVFLCLTGLCLLELHQYHIFFVQNDLYELVPKDLLRAVKMLK